MQGFPIKKYNIYEFTIRDDEYYPDGMNVLLANDRDYKAINDAGDDDLVYHYVDDEIDLRKVKVGDTLELDVDFEVLAIEENKYVDADVHNHPLGTGFAQKDNKENK